MLGLSLVGQGLFGHIDLLLLRGDAALRWCQGLDGFDRGYLVKSHADIYRRLPSAALAENARQNSYLTEHTAVYANQFG